MRYVAFLRAINVGGHVVKMDRLRTLFEELGLAKVETFIASGNVLFDSRAAATTLETRIEKHLRAALGYEVATFLRTGAELAAVGERDVNYVGFLRSEPSASAREKLLALKPPDDDLTVEGREVYWMIRTRISDSPLNNARLEKALGMPMTMRNMNTVRKLAAKLA